MQAAQDKHQFSPIEGALLTECGANRGVTESLFEDTWLAQVHVFTCGDADLAQSAASTLLAKQIGFGYRQVAGPDGLPEMFADGLTDVPDVPVDERLFYTAGRTLVRIEIRGHDQAAANQGMAEAVSTVSSNYPAK